MRQLEDEGIGFAIQDQQQIDKSVRLDVALVNDNLAKSRTSAAELITSGCVSVDGMVILKPSFNASLSATIQVIGDDWVGRGGKKLSFFLDEINFCVLNKECIDVGASVGGFTQALIKRGAQSVVAIDVGHNQLHESLRANPRVTNLEAMDIRNYTSKEFDLVVCDLSFISIEKIIMDLLRLAKSDIIILFKPQFEVGRLAKRNKKGVVIDIDAIDKAVVNFEALLGAQNLTIKAHKPCALAGKEGNIEQFYYVAK